MNYKIFRKCGEPRDQESGQNESPPIYKQTPMIVHLILIN